jgi:hypothetical protein
MEIILKALDIICASRIWQDKPPSHTLRVLLYMQNKGWLYVPSISGEIQAVIGAYRIPDVNEETLSRLPVKEEGTILYVPFVVSTTEEYNMYKVVRESMKQYLIQNPDITEIVLEGKDDKLRRYKIGVNNGKEQKLRASSTTNV